MAEKISIFSGRATEYLAKKIADAYGQNLGEVVVTDFSDGEFQPSFEENIRGRIVFLIQSTFAPTDNFFELLMMIDAAKRASAKQIIAVIPYFGFARQDRKDKPRVSIASKMVANILTAAGVTRVITIDLHADQIQGFFDVPVDHIYASSIYIPYIKQLDLPELIFASPDTGGTRRAASYAKALNKEFVICYKQRGKPNEIERIALIGDVSDKNVILLDDIIDTAGTITKAADVIMENGAKSVRGFCTHPLLSADSYEKIEKSAFKEVIVSDTIPLKRESKKIKVISTSALFADVINRLVKNKSISSLFKM